MDIGEVLTVSFQKTWKYKLFWLFGALPFVLNAFYMPVSQFVSPFNEVLLPGFFEPFLSWQVELVGNLLSLGVLFLSIPLFFFGMLALTTGVVRAENREARLLLGELMQDVLRFFWRALGVRAIFFFGTMAILFPILFMGFFVSAFTMGLGALCMFPLFFLFIPVSYTIYALMEMAEAAVVADDLSVMDAISKTWMLVKTNFLQLFLLAVIVYMGISLVAFIVLPPLLLPVYFPFFSVFIENVISARDAILISMACLCISMPLYVLFQGVMLALQKTAWTQAYLALTRKPVQQAPVEVFNVG